MEYQERRAPLAVPACAEPLAQWTYAAVGSPWQVPRSQPDGLAVVLSVLEARRALWESIGAWEDLVAEWRSTPFEELDIHAEVPITRHPFLCRRMPLMRVLVLRV